MPSISLNPDLTLTSVVLNQEEGTPPVENESFDPDAFDVDAFDPDAFSGLT